MTDQRIKMTDQQILDGLNDIFRDVFGDDKIVVKPNTTAKDINGWDSFNHLNIIVGAESRFGFTAHAAEIERLTKVGDLVALISKKVNG